MDGITYFATVGQEQASDDWTMALFVILICFILLIILALIGIVRKVDQEHKTMETPLDEDPKTQTRCSTVTDAQKVEEKSPSTEIRTTSQQEQTSTSYVIPFM